MDSTEQIWHEYHSKLHSFIQARVGDPAAADDLLQEVFLRIHSRLKSLRESSRIKSWIYQITRNAIIDHYRSRRRMEELPETLAAPKLEPGDDNSGEMADCLLPMIQSLPEKYRQALMLAEIEGLKHKEVAAKEGLSLSSAKARVHRGRAMMKKMLSGCCHFEFDRLGKVIDYEGKGPGCDCGKC